MKPQPTIDPNAAGDEVKRLLADDGNANASLKDIRSAKLARKEALKSALTIVWQAFESGATVNGYSTRKEWAPKFAKVTMRTCPHIIFGRKPSEANKSSLDGLTVALGGFDSLGLDTNHEGRGFLTICLLQEHEETGY